MKQLGFLIAASIICSALLFPARSAFAHVLVRDTTGSTGAILHIVPDDDPIAGKQATLFFDMQGKPDDTADIRLSITKEGARTPSTVQTERHGSLVTADYIFPSQGVYRLRYEIDAHEATQVFMQSIRVTRGVAAETLDTPRHTWAEGVLLLCAAIFAVLAIVAYNQRRDIAKQSTF